MKSTEGDHRKAADVLKKALGYHARPEQGDRLRSILSLKGRISYGGHSLHWTKPASARSAEVFCAWAETLYVERPPTQG